MMFIPLSIKLILRETSNSLQKNKYRTQSYEHEQNSKCTYIAVTDKIMAIWAFTICPTVFDLRSTIFNFVCKSSAVDQPSPTKNFILH